MAVGDQKRGLAGFAQCVEMGALSQFGRQLFGGQASSGSPGIVPFGRVDDAVTIMVETFEQGVGLPFPLPQDL